MQQSRTHGAAAVHDRKAPGGQSTAHLTHTQNRKAFRGFKHLTNVDTSATAMTPGAMPSNTNVQSGESRAGGVAAIKMEDSSMRDKTEASEQVMSGVMPTDGMYLPGSSALDHMTPTDL